MVAGAARMIGHGGVDAMSLRVLAERFGVPLGSTYHYFPGGKAQLVDEAVRLEGAQVVALLRNSPVSDPASVLHAFADMWRAVLTRSGYDAGCSVLAAASATDAGHRQAAKEVFEDWHRALEDALVTSGVVEDRAPRLARTIIASVEGAIGLCRAAASADALDDVVAELSALVDAARTADDLAPRR
jgi:AcrR family transcriptional regulator